jgi:uncharacterized protein (TIGR02453 family)
MISKSTFKFLKDLKANNNKPWFDANRTAYDAARSEYFELVAQVINALEKIDPKIAAAQLEAKKCVSRINRDIRFSKDKSPYKTNFGAMLNCDGKKGVNAGYYLHLEHGDCFVAAGIYMPDAKQLAAIRQEIDYNFAAFKKIVQSKTFLANTDKGLYAYESLVRPPKGYSEDNPALEYLKMKGFIATRKISEQALSTTQGVKDIAAAFKAMKDVVAFLNAAIEE